MKATSSIAPKHLIFRLLLAVGVVVILLLMNPEHAQACRCAPPSSPAQEFALADAVFSGKAVKAVALEETIHTHGLPGDLDVEVTFQADTIWKGSQQETIVVYTSSYGPACGYVFAIGSMYLVYAREVDSIFQVSSCSRTIPLQFAQTDLAFLKKGRSSPSSSSSSSTLTTAPSSMLIALLAIGVLVVAVIVNERIRSQ